MLWAEQVSVARQVGFPLPTGPAPSCLGLGLTAFCGISPMDIQRVGRGTPLPFPSMSPTFKGFTVTVLSLVPRCGTCDCNKLAVGSVLTSPNAHIMERQRSVNEWIRGTAASSTNLFLLMIFFQEISPSPNSNLHSL